MELSPTYSRDAYLKGESPAPAFNIASPPAVPKQKGASSKAFPELSAEAKKVKTRLVKSLCSAVKKTKHTSRSSKPYSEASEGVTEELALEILGTGADGKSVLKVKFEDEDALTFLGLPSSFEVENVNITGMKMWCGPGMNGRPKMNAEILSVEVKYTKKTNLLTFKGRSQVG